MEKQTTNGQKILLMKVISKANIFYICILLLASINSLATNPIAYLDTFGYEPAQKELAISKNGMVTTQHFLATAVGEKIINMVEMLMTHQLRLLLL